MTHSLELDLIKPDRKDLLYLPCARIYVKTHAEDKHKPSFLFITPKCFGINELESQIDRLHEELEDIKKKARRMFE